MKIKAFLFSMLISLGAFSQGMNLNESLTWKQVLAKASAESKPIFVDAYTSWCGPCKWMAKNVFVTDSVGKFYNSNFISYKLDMEKGEGIDFAKRYEVKFFPTYLYFDKQGNLIHRSGGSKPVAEFIKDGQDALDPNKQLVTLSKKFEADKNNKEIVVNYVHALLNAGESSADAAEAYFELADEKERLSADAFHVYESLSEMNSSSFKFMKENKSRFDGVSEKDIEDLISARYVNHVLSLGKSSDISGFTTLHESIERDLGKLGWKEMNVYYYRAGKDFNSFVRYADELANDSLFIQADKLNNMAWVVYGAEQSTEEDLKKALMWSGKSLRYDNSWYNLDTYAHLLFRLNKLDEAEKYGKEAVRVAESMGEDAKDTKELLGKIEGKRK